jgi:hypothetical protein
VAGRCHPTEPPARIKREPATFLAAGLGGRGPTPALG